MEEIIKLVKLQNMWTTSAYDALIKSKIQSCVRDLQSVGISNACADSEDPLIREAILTYCSMNMGKPPADEYDRLKRAYDEMKGQMQSITGYGLAVSESD